MTEAGSSGLEKFKHKRILITGASGFIGSNLATALCKLGATVFGTSRFDRVGSRETLTWIKCSFENFDDTKKVFEDIKPDIIYHLSGEVTASNDSKHVIPTFQSLVASTVNILTEATRLNCERVILTGSCTEPSELESPAGSPYAAAKSATRIYGNMFQQCYGTPVVIVRPFVGYGPGQSPGKLIPYVINSFLNNDPPKLSSGKWKSDWIYIDDVIEGMLLTTLAPNIEGLTIDLGTGLLTSVREVVLEIQKMVSSKIPPEFGALPDRDNEFIRLADVEETFAKLGWRAKTTLVDGLIKTISAYRKELRSA